MLVHHVEGCGLEDVWGEARGGGDHERDLGEAAKDAAESEGVFAGGFEEDEGAGGRGIEDLLGEGSGEADVLEDVAVDDEVGTAGGGVGDGGDSGCGRGAGDVVEEELGVAEEAEHEVAVVSAMIEDAADGASLEVLAEDGGELGAAGLVVVGGCEVGVEGGGVPGLEGAAHLEVLGGAVADVFAGEFGVVGAGVVEDESAGLALNEADAEGVAVPDAPCDEGRDKGRLELAELAIADDAG